MFGSRRQPVQNHGQTKGVVTALTLHQLMVFDTVARHRSITKASKELHVSQPSVFQQVKFLEDSCGVKLYRKIGRGIELTRDGQSFQTDVGDILLRIDKLRQKLVDTEIRARASSLIIRWALTPCQFPFCFQSSQLLKRATHRFALHFGLGVALVLKDSFLIPKLKSE